MNMKRKEMALKNIYYQIYLYLRLILTIGLLRTPIKCGLSTTNSICGGGGNFTYVKKVDKKYCTIMTNLRHVS